MKRKVLIFASIIPVFLFVSGAFILENRSSIYNGSSFSDKINFLDIFSKKQEVKKEESVKMLFFGDLMLDRDVKARLRQDGMEYILGGLQKENFFSGYDIISANLEGTVTNDGKYYWPEKQFDFAFLPEDVLKLKKYGFNFFNVANNHSYDQGRKGVAETEENLKNMGYNFSGCMDGSVGGCSSTVLNIKDKKVGMAGFSIFGAFDLNKAEDIIFELDKIADIIAVNIHWGDEYKTKHNEYQEKIAHGLIDAGADIIIGHHPHVVEDIEEYKGKYIFYSLGNFIFYQYFSDEVKTGLAVAAEFKENDIFIKLEPIISNWIAVSLVNENKKKEILEKIAYP